MRIFEKAAFEAFLISAGRRAHYAGKQPNASVQQYQRAHLAAREDIVADRHLLDRPRVEQALARFGAGVLTDREMSIARMVLRGNSSKAIAERLAISPETVKVHRRHLYAKLGISSQPELFSRFIQALGEDAAG